MAYLEKTHRLDRSQGAIIFWGLVSACFAIACCYYLKDDIENKGRAIAYHDQVLALEEQRESLSAQKDKLQADIGESDKALKARSDFLQEKETKLAAEESRIESLGQQSNNQAAQSQSQAAVVKKFDDTVRKIAKDGDTDVLLRGGRPVLRIPNSIFFALGDTTLTAKGKSVLNQIDNALSGQMDNFELRVETFTDSDGEIPKPSDPTKPDAKPDPDKNATAKAHLNSWDLTAARAGVLSHYLRDQSSLPFQNIVVVARADSSPIVANSKDGHARNRRIEITIAPTPVAYHPPDVSHGTASTAPTSPANPLEPPPDPPAGQTKAN